MKFLLLTVLATIIIFFTWNILKRIFFKKFYNYFQQNIPKAAPEKENKSSINQTVKWDAETIDFEEVKEDQYGKK